MAQVWNLIPRDSLIQNGGTNGHQKWWRWHRRCTLACKIYTEHVQMSGWNQKLHTIRAEGRLKLHIAHGTCEECSKQRITDGGCKTAVKQLRKQWVYTTSALRPAAAPSTLSAPLTPLPVNKKSQYLAIILLRIAPCDTMPVNMLESVIPSLFTSMYDVKGPTCS